MRIGTLPLIAEKSISTCSKKSKIKRSIMLAFSRSSSWMLVNMVRKLMVKVSKVLLGVVMTLKVHEEYGSKEVRPTL